MPSRLFGAGGSATTDASLLATGTLPLARLSGITTTQLDAAAGITSGQIAALDAGKLTTGTLPLARLSGLTTSNLSASAALVAGQIASVNPSALTGSGTVPLAGLSGITTTQLSASAGILGSQLDAAAAITSAQIAALDAAKITTGTLPLARLSGITTSQLAAGAAITSGQIASVAAATITGTHTLPDGALSTNVPLLNAANTFTAKLTTTGDVSCKTIIPGTLDTFAYASTITLDVTLAEVHETTTVNATGNATINASSGGTAGQRMSIIVNNDATSGKIITWGTNIRTSSGIATGTANKAFCISLISDGTSWFQMGSPQTGL